MVLRNVKSLLVRWSTHGDSKVFSHFEFEKVVVSFRREALNTVKSCKKLELYLLEEVCWTSRRYGSQSAAVNRKSNCNAEVVSWELSVGADGVAAEKGRTRAERREPNLPGPDLPFC